MPRGMIVASLLVAGAFIVSPVFSQLAPPPGPVQGTDRTRINQQSIFAFPYVIAQPGSYVLTSNINVPPGLDGIVVDADGVTLDLNGFTIRGSGGAGARTGIRTNVPRSRLAVMNGSVADWTGMGIDFWNSEQIRIVNVQARSCGVNGTLPTLYAGITVGAQATVELCSASFNSFNGIVAGDGASIRGCTARNNSRSGIEAQNDATVTDSTSMNNGYRGFLVMSNARIEGCTAENNGYGVFGPGTGIRTNEFAVIKGCAARTNADAGITATSRSVIEDSTAHYNGGCGISAGYGTTVQSCVTNDNGQYQGDARPVVGAELCSPARDASLRNLVVPQNEDAGRSDARGAFSNDGISVGDGSSVLDCISQGIADDGIAAYFGSVVSRCTARFNRDADISMDFGEGSILDCVSEYSYGFGVRVGEKTKVRGNTVNRATTDGISAAGECEIVGNTVTQSGFSGVQVYGSRSRVHDNQVTFNQTGISVTAPSCIVTSNRASANGFSYNLWFGTVQGQIVNMVPGGVIFMNDPWMNLEY